MTVKANVGPNELYPELMSVSSLQPWDGANSSGRKYMFAGHVAQTLPIAEPTERRTQTGMERQYGKYTNQISMPENGTILKVIDLYPTGYSQNSISNNPLSLVIFETEEGEIDCVEVIGYHYHYFNYGFKYQPMEGMSKLREGESLAKGTPFMDSTSKTANGAYRYGRECNIAFISHHAVAEDGFVVARSLLPKLAYRTYEKRIVSWGRDKFPINLYGDENTYKPFPDIGELVHPDGCHKGLLMALREYDDDLAIIEQNKTAVSYPDVMFDDCVYVGGKGGKVVDIRVYHDPNSSLGGTDEAMSVQPKKYHDATMQFYYNIVQYYDKLKRDRRELLRLKPDFHRYIVDALAVVGNNYQGLDKKDKVELTYRRKMLDEWMVEFTIEHVHIPGIGSKLTDTSGGKGVICAIEEDENMPIDKFGNRAEILADPNATFSRMNLARLFETFVNACSKHLSDQIRATILQHIPNLDLKQSPKLMARRIQSEVPTQVVDGVWSDLISYYLDITPRQAEWMTNGSYKESREHHLAYVLQEGIYLHIPTDNEPEYMSYINKLAKRFPDIIGPVTYKDSKGRTVVSKENVLISTIYTLLLEKTGSDWAAVSSAKTQQHGILAPLSSHDKYSSPVKQQPTRSTGEAEVRSYTGYVSPRITADILDRNNNPVVHKEMVINILNAPQPTNIDCLVDRNKFPLGFSKPLQIVKHMAECAGYEFDYADMSKPIKKGNN